MKNIILQHYDGELGELEKLSIDNISNYAKKCGAEYELVLGRPMGNKLSVQSQKLCVLSDKYDDYDMVVMLEVTYLPPRLQIHYPHQYPSLPYW